MSPVVSSQTAKANFGHGSPRADSFTRAQPRAVAARRHARVRAAKVPGARKIVNDLLPGFSRQLAAMLNAGMPIVAALDALHDQADNPNFKAVIGQTRKSIEGGAAFSEALVQFPAIFSELYVNMVKGGETGGQLAETIGRLAGVLEASARLRRKIKSAMMYPTIVLCIALTIATAMIVFIVPVFGDMFADFGADLPRPTLLLMRFSSFLRRNGAFILIGLVAAIVAFRKWKTTERGAYAFDQLMLKLPVFGELTRKVASARFARSFGQLIHSGVPILSALDIVAGATGNRVAGRVIGEARTTVERGDPLSSALLRDQTVFPVVLVRMLQAGEKTGRVDEMMDNIADFFDEEVETMLSGLTSLLEPLLMVFLGVVIGGLVLCMFLPIFRMADIVSA